ncbi:MAG: ABC transporter ATP-binding protein [Spirochaetia bacterium]
MPGIKVENFSFSYGSKKVIDTLDIEILDAKMTMLIGSNGCGKSTLLRSIARLITPEKGHIVLDGEDIARIKTKALAKKLSILPQACQCPQGLTIIDLVKQGRYPHQNLFQQWTEKDEEIVLHALKDTGLMQMRDQKLDELSGGQRQRAWIAMVLAQETEVILLDEPITYLDIAHQIEVLDLLHLLNRKKNRTIIMVLHDLNLAARYGDILIAMANQNIYAHGSPQEVMTEENVKHIFNIDNTIIEDPIFKTPLCIPYSCVYHCNIAKDK